MPERADDFLLMVYVDGSDLDSAAPLLREPLRRYAIAGPWSGSAKLIEYRAPPDSAAPGFLPQWDLGLRLGLSRALPADLAQNVAALLDLLREIHVATGREFELFLAPTSVPHRQEHLAFVGTKPPAPSWLCAAIKRLVEGTTP